MSASEQINRELNWRESELGALKIILNRSDISEKQREVLLRASWALLYAHYEGFVKFCLTLFYDELQALTQECKSLPPATRAFALSKTLKQMRNDTSNDMLSKIESFADDHLSTPPKFPEVSTDSNLKSQVLAKLLETADLDFDIITKHEAKVNTLVSRRNEIAHGEKNFISETSYYISFEEVVYEIMYDLALSVIERLDHCASISNAHSVDDLASQSD